MADTRTLTIRITVDNSRAVTSIRNLSTELNNLLKNNTKGAGGALADGLAKNAKGFKDAATELSAAQNAMASRLRESLTGKGINQPLMERFRMAREGYAEMNAGERALQSRSRQTAEQQLADGKRVWQQQQSLAAASAAYLRRALTPTGGSGLSGRLSTVEQQRDMAGLALQQRLASVTSVQFMGSANGLTGALQRMASGLKATKEQQRELRKEMDTARRSAYAYTIAGFQLQYTLGAVTRFAKDAIAQFAEFDFTTRRAAGALGVFDTLGSTFADLSNTIADTAISAKLFSPNDIAKGYYYWGSTTGQVVQSHKDLLAIQQQILPVMQLSAITQTDLETALKGVYAVMQQYGMGMENAREVTERLFLVAQKTAVEVPDLLESFKMVGPIANSIGVPFDDVIGMLGALGNAGIKGTMAGRALRQTFIKLTDPTVRASAALDAATKNAYGLNKSFNDVIFPEGKFIGMQGYLDALNKITKDLTETERNRLLGIITTNNELPSLIKLLDANAASYQTNKEGIVEYQTALYGAAEASKVFGGAVENQMQSAQAVIGELRNTLAAISILIGQRMWEMFGPILTAIASAAKSLLSTLQNNRTLSTITALVIGLVGAFAAFGSFILITTGAWRLLHAVIVYDMQLMPRLAANLLRVGANLGFITKEAATSTAALIQQRAATRAAESATAGLNPSVLNFIKTVAPKLLRLRVIIGSLFTGFVVLPIVMELIRRHGEGLAKAIGSLSDKFDLLLDGVGKVGAYLVDSMIGGLSDIISKTAEVGSNFIDWLLAIISTNKELKEFGRTIDSITGKSKQPTWQENYANQKFMPDAATGTSAFSLQDQLNQSLKNDEQKYLQTSFRSGERTAWSFTKGLADAADAVKQGYVAAIYTPATMVMANLSDYAEQEGELVAQAFNSGILGVDTANMTTLLEKNVTDSFKALSSRGGNVAQTAAESAAQWADTFFFHTKKDVPPVIAGIVGFMESSLASENSNIRAMGADVMAWMMGDAKNFGAKVAPDVISAIMAKIRDSLNSANPAIQKQGREMAANLARGFAMQPGLDERVKSTLENWANMIASGTPEMAKSGYDLMVNWISGQVQGFDRNIKSLTDRIALIDKLMSAAGPNIGGSRDKALTGRRAALQTLIDQANDMKTFKPIDLSGGASSTETQQSPLEKALDVARQAAELAENLGKVAGKDVKAMVKSSMGKIASAVLLADQITYDITKSFSKSKLTRVAEFSDASSKVMSLISDAVEAFDKIRRFKEVPKASFKSLKSNIIEVIKSIEDAAKSFKDANLLAAAVVFSESANTVMEMLGKAIDLFAKMPSSYTRTPRKVWDEITLDIAQVINSVRVASRKVHAELLPEIENFATSAATIVGAVGTAIDTLDKAMSMGDYERIPTTVIDNITLDIAAMVNAMRRASAKVHTDLMDEIEAFAKSSKEVVDAIGAALSVFANIPREIDIPDGSIFTPISQRIADMANALGAAAEGVDATLLKQAKFFAEKVGPVVTVIRDAVDALNAVSTYAAPDPTQIAAVAEGIRLVMQEISKVVKKSKFSKKELDAITSFSSSAQAAVGAVRAAADAFAEKVVDLVGEGQTKEALPIVATVAKMGETMDEVLGLTKRFKNVDISAIKSLAEAARTVVETVKTFYETMSPQDLGTEGASEMIKNISESIKIVLATISSALVPFVSGFRVTGGDIVKNLATGMREQKADFNDEVAGLVAALNQVSAVNAQLQAQLIVTQSLMVTVEHLFGPGVSNMTAAQLGQIVNASNSAIAKAITGTKG